MSRRIGLAGLASVVVLALWGFVGNAVPGLRPSIDMQRPGDMEQVYQVPARHPGGLPRLSLTGVRRVR